MMIDTIPASGTGVFCFTLINPTTGAASVADSLPTGKALRSQSGAAPAIDVAVTVTIGNTGMDTGTYYVTWTVPPGYANGDVGAIQITVVMNGVTSRITDYHFRVGPRVAPTSTGLVQLDMTQAVDTTITTDTVGGALAGATVNMRKIVLNKQPGLAGATETIYKADGTTPAKVFDTSVALTRS